MNRVSTFLSIAAATAAMTGVAFAEDPKPDDAGGAAGAGAAAGGTATVGTDGAKVDASATVGMFTAATWPKAYVDRPQVAGKGMIEVTPIFDFARKTTTVMGTSSSTNATQINLGGRYGINDKIEALASFNRIILSPSPTSGGDRVKGQLTAGVGIGLAKGKLDAEVKVAVGYDLLAKNAPLLAGVDVRYHLGPKMWVGTPVNRPGLVLFLKGTDITLPTVPPTTVTISPIFFNIPVAFAYQATPDLAIQANTALMRLNLNDDAKGGPMGSTATFFGTDDFGGIPLDIDAIYAISNKMDVIGNLNFGDLKHIGDNLGITAGVNIRM